MQLVDTHCHIHEADYGVSIDDVLTRAKEAGVTRMLCVGTTAKNSEEAVAFVQNHPNMWAAVGLHPHDAKDGQPALKQLAGLCEPAAARNKIVAIGECGLDYFYNHSDKKEQEKALRFQIELALLHKLPLVFHVREAFDDFWPVFDSYQGIRGVLHSFTDSQRHLEKALERGLYIGVNGIATFTKVDAQLAMYAAIPLNRLLLETDAPFLTPKPYRGTVNEPAHVRLVAGFIAQLQNQPVHTIAAATTQNAQTLLKL